MRWFLLTGIRAIGFAGEVVILVGIGEDRTIEVRQAGVAFDDILELAIVDLFMDLRAEQAIEIVETVTIHQRLDLRHEHGVEGFTQQTTRNVGFGETADP